MESRDILVNTIIQIYSIIPLSNMSNRRKHTKRKSRRSNNRKLRKTRKQKSILQYAKSCVKNFSNYQLSDTEYIVLSKGMKFVPILKHSHVKLNQTLMRSFNRLARNLRCKYELDDGSDYHTHPFYVCSNYKPPTASNALENYIFHTKLEISNLKICTSKQNLSIDEWKALSTLKQNKTIVIKPADKTKTIVIQNKSNYIKEGERQLSQKYYVKIENPTTENIKQKVIDIINQLYNQNLIDEMTNKYLRTNFNPTPGTIYFLPKIHKLSETILNSSLNNYTSNLLIPSRPIVSQINSCTQKIGRLADIFLLPVVQNQDTYLKDTKDFINKIESIKCNSNIVLATYDITSMYTNMTIEELLSAVQRALIKIQNCQETDLKIPFIGIENVVNILKLQLENNEFEFAGQFYKQVIGCSMGAVPSPEVSDLRAYEIINTILSKYPFKKDIVAHYRFRDDGFIILQSSSSQESSIEKLKLLFDIANKEHNLLKFTYNISMEEVTFLDTTIYKGQRYNTNGTLDIKSFHKPTESYAYLLRTSCHNHKVFKGILKGEIIRQIRNNSDQKNLTKEIQLIKKRFAKRGYKITEMNKIIASALEITRQQTLQNEGGQLKSKTNPIFITKYYTGLHKLSKILRKHWHFIENDEDTKFLFPRPPLIAFKRNKNLSQFLTSAKVHTN